MQFTRKVHESTGTFLRKFNFEYFVCKPEFNNVTCVNYQIFGNTAQFKQWFRTCAMNRYICSYFPIKLVKTTDLDPNKSYLFCNFPHGIVSTGVCVAFGTDAAGYSEIFPGIEIRVVILDRHFKTPMFREYCRITCTYHLEIVVQSSCKKYIHTHN
ncbi:hypothetical protein E2986_14058 [Frieseomelitta varia]|uniref:diacylglycerol O-acyltransferase n=1 Tax=Frieseomelitta varia TaxID=561572 RepID=A0A833RN39_9HYME|nr:hypothetical protein E2986_14058 [Frieseomelitta varia]